MADLAHISKHGHPWTILERLRPAAFHRLDHFRWVALFAKAPRAGFTGVPLGNFHLPLGQVHPRRIPGNSDHVVFTAVQELVLDFGLRRELRTSVIHPLLPGLPEHGSLQTIRAVHATVEGIALQAHTGVPCEGASVSVQVLVALVVIVLLDPHDHAVSDEGAHAASMCIVRRADVGKRRVIPILVVIHTLPRPVRILTQRIAHLDHGLERR